MLVLAVQCFFDADRGERAYRPASLSLQAAATGQRRGGTTSRRALPGDTARKPLGHSDRGLVSCERTHFPAFGFEGGQAGAPGELHINREQVDPKIRSLRMSSECFFAISCVSARAAVFFTLPWFDMLRLVPVSGVMAGVPLEASAPPAWRDLEQQFGSKEPKCISPIAHATMCWTGATTCCYF
jgi:hypothetical protein